MRALHCRWRGDSSLAREAEAYLAGRYLALMSQRDGWVPAWAWLNRCAHGDLAILHALSGEASAGLSVVALSWASAERLLAAELLAIVDGEEELLRNLQWRVLIPLEIVLIDREGTEELTPRGLILCVRAALRSLLS